MFTIIQTVIRKDQVFNETSTLWWHAFSLQLWFSQLIIDLLQKLLQPSLEKIPSKSWRKVVFSILMSDLCIVIKTNEIYLVLCSFYILRPLGILVKCIISINYCYYQKSSVFWLCFCFWTFFAILDIVRQIFFYVCLCTSISIENGS